LTHVNGAVPDSNKLRAMDLLDFARGPALAFAIAVFVLGSAWRLFGVLRLPRLPDRSPARAGAPSNAAAAARAIVRGMWPRRAFSPRTQYVTVNGYVFHVGLALVFFGYAPHIAFIHRITGVSWPALPDAVMYYAAAASGISLALALAMRLTDPVRRRISRADDWISWTLVFLPLFTGMAVLVEPSQAVLAHPQAIYRGPLAVHLLSLELLLLWFPFGKLMHAVLFAFSRGATGIRFGHRGVDV
jgi:nitrate reductase gamma subunit